MSGAADVPGETDDSELVDAADSVVAAPDGAVGDWLLVEDSPDDDGD